MSTPTSENMVKLISSDDKEFTVPLEIANVSVTIKNMLEDIGETDSAIPLPNVNALTLEKILDWCKYHQEHPLPVLDEKDAMRTDNIPPWDQDFLKLDQEKLFNLILAANYLDIKPLLELSCKTVANMIKGKTPEEIRKTFNIKNDFTPEEEEEIRKENEWCEER